MIESMFCMVWGLPFGIGMYDSTFYNIMWNQKVYNIV